MFEIITKKISNKIIVALFALMFISSTTIVYITTSKVTKDSIANAKENLGMLNASMFQTLRNTMNTGDPALIAKAEEEARQIKGVKNLTVAKGKSLMELYKFPLVIIISHRGTEGETICGQIPMGESTPRLLNAMDFHFFEPTNSETAYEDVKNAWKLSVEEGKPVSVLLEIKYW